MDECKGIFYINNIPLIYYETYTQVEAIEESYEFLKLITVDNIYELRDYIFTDVTLIRLDDNLNKGMQKIFSAGKRVRLVNYEKPLHSLNVVDENRWW